MSFISSKGTPFLQIRKLCGIGLARSLSVFNWDLFSLSFHLFSFNISGFFFWLFCMWFFTFQKLSYCCQSIWLAHLEHNIIKTHVKWFCMPCCWQPGRRIQKWNRMTFTIMGGIKNPQRREHSKCFTLPNHLDASNISLNEYKIVLGWTTFGSECGLSAYSWIFHFFIFSLLSRSPTRLWALLTLNWTSPTRVGRWWSWEMRPPTCSQASTRAPRTPSPCALARPKATALLSSPSSPPRSQVSTTHWSSSWRLCWKASLTSLYWGNSSENDGCSICLI